MMPGRAIAEDVRLYERGGGNAAPHLDLHHSYVIIRYSPLAFKRVKNSTYPLPRSWWLRPLEAQLANRWSSIGY